MSDATSADIPLMEETSISNIYGALKLHRRIARNKWCVTREDLKSFRMEVKAAILNKDIRPIDLDPFDPKDDLIGPNIYTVNAQFIKPVTATAGNMSWALMRHPDGRECDLFITHAWAEGVFEFIDKVLNSWPHGARHAYCCMLSNPQNLNISELICNPLASPFAEALRSAQYMLVVPNRATSIYTRLWCAFEAYLAYKWGKVITVARTPTRSHMLKNSAIVAIVALAGVVMGLLRRYVSASSSSWEKGSFIYIFLASLCASVLLQEPRWLSFFRRFGAGCLGYMAVITDLMIGDAPPSSEILYNRIICFSLVCYFILAEFDVAVRLQARHEAGHLLHGFTGSVLDAQCAVEKDKLQILSEIGHLHEDVDHAIQALISTGMWSNRLRRAREAGVDIQDVTRAEVALPSTAWMFDFATAAYWFSLPDTVCKVLAVVLLVCRVAWVVCLFSWVRETWAFAIKAEMKLAMIALSTCISVQIFWILVSGRRSDSVGLAWFCESSVIVKFVVSFLIGFASIDGVALMPGCGRALTQALVGRGSKLLARDVETTSSEENSSESIVP